MPPAQNAGSPIRRGQSRSSFRSSARSNATAAHYEYDPAADSYTAKTGMPTPRTWGTCAVVNNRIYVIGGYAYPGGTTNVNEVYDPATDTWSTKAPLPVQKYGVTRENPVINGFIYVTHGRDANFYTSNYLYDPATDAWRQKGLGGPG